MIDVPDNDWCWKTRMLNAEFQGFRCMIAVTYTPDDRFSELGYIGPKSDSHMARLAEDSCTILNGLLQRFVSPDTLCELVRRDDRGHPESILGEIVLQLTQSP